MAKFTHVPPKIRWKLSRGNRLAAEVNPWVPPPTADLIALRESPAELLFPERNENWLVSDSKSFHICGNKEYFRNLEPIEIQNRVPVKLDKNNVRYPMGKGTVDLEAKINGSWMRFRLLDVIYIPGHQNILSEVKFTADNYQFDVKKGKFRYIGRQKKDIETWQEKGATFIKFRPLPLVKTDAPLVKLEDIFEASEYAMIYHLRLGHLTKGRIRAAIGSRLINCYSSENIDVDCKWCSCFPNEEKPEATSEVNGKPGDFVYVYGVKQVNINSRDKYCILLKDKATSYVWGITAKDASDVGMQVKDFLKNFFKFYKLNVQIIRLCNDIGPEILAEFKKLEKKTIVHVLEHQTDLLSDVKSKSTFLHIINRMQHMIALAALPTNIWDIALWTSVYLHNCAPISQTAVLTPYEQLKKIKPSLDHIRIIGSLAFPFDKKLNKSGKWILVGHSAGKEYIIYNQLLDKVVVTDQVLIYEEEQILPYISKTLSMENPDLPSAPPQSLIKDSTPPTPNTVKTPKTLSMETPDLPSAPPQSLIEDSTPPTPNTVKFPKIKLREVDLKFIFQMLKTADKNDKQRLNDILEPLDKQLNDFLKEIREIVPYNNTAACKRSKSLDLFEMKLKREFEPLEASSDGHCLFHSISLALYGEETYFLHLRLLLLRHILENWDVLLENSPKIFSNNLEWVTRTAVDLKEWGNEQHCFLFSSVLGRPIFVAQIHDYSWTVQNNIYNSDMRKENQMPIYLLLSNLHYEPLVPRPYKIISSITKQNSLNFYLNTDHKYRINGNLDVGARFADLEQATRLYPNLEHEMNMISRLSPPVYDVTDNDDSEAEKIYSCVKCKATNDNLRKVFSENADLRKKMRQLISKKLHSENLPIMPCESCKDSTIYAKNFEEEKTKLKLQANEHEEKLIKKISMLRYEIENVNRQKKDLELSQNHLRNTLAKKSAETCLLEKQIVVLGTELEKYIQQDAQQSSTSDLTTNTLFVSFPPPTPGRDLPVKQIASNRLGPASVSGSDRNSNESQATTSTRSSTNSSTSQNTSSSSSNRSSSTSNSGAKIKIDFHSPSVLRSASKTEPSQHSSQVQLMSPDLVQEIEEYLGVLENLHQLPIMATSPVDLHKDLYLTSSSNSSEVGQQILKRKNFRASDSDSYIPICSAGNGNPSDRQRLSSISVSPVNLSLASSSHSSEVGQHVFKRKSLHVSDSESSGHEDLGINGNNSDTTWDLGLNDSSSDNDDDFPPPVPKKDLGRNKTQQKKNVKESNNSRLAVQGKSTSSIHKCVFCSQNFLSQGMYDTHMINYHDVDGYEQHVRSMRKSKSQTATVCESKKKSKKSTNVSAQNSISKKITTEPLASTINEHRQGFRVINGANGLNFDVRFPIAVKTNDKKLDVASQKTTAFKFDKEPKVVLKRIQTSRNAKEGNNVQKEPEKKFKCNLCEKAYTAKSSLQRHLDSTAHSNIPFHCRICDGTFSTHENLVKHSRRFHSGDRTQNCRFCAHKLTKSKNAMISHEKLHHYKQWLASEKIKACKLSSDESE